MSALPHTHTLRPCPFYKPHPYLIFTEKLLFTSSHDIQFHQITLRNIDLILRTVYLLQHIQKFQNTRILRNSHKNPIVS